MDRAAAKRVFDSAYIEKLRKEFLLLMKNAKIVKTPEQAYKWAEYLRNWRDGYEELLQERIPEVIRDLPLQFPHQVSRQEAKALETYVRKEGWGLYINASVPIRRPDNYWSEDMAFRDFQKDLKTWESRLRRSARQAWKGLKYFADYYQRVAKSAPALDIAEDEQTNLEGFQVLVKNYTDRSSFNEEYLERFKEGLKRYKSRAQKVLPLLLQIQLPLVLDFKGGLDEGGRYHKSYIWINAHASERNPGRMAQILAHEMGHHVWQMYLPKAANDFWRRAISGNYGDLDLRDVLKRFGNEKSFYDNKNIKQRDPILYLQIDGLFSDGGSASQTFAPRSGRSLFSMDDVRDYLADGGQAVWRVHGKPITGYAHKNPEEAFCEALGMLVGYGPRAVLPEVREWLKTILPNIKIAFSPIASRSVVMSNRSAGKKERRSIKDKKHSDKLKGRRDVKKDEPKKKKGPKSQEQKKFEGEMRKKQVERGQFGLPGAGRGGKHETKKQKSKRPDRKQKHKKMDYAASAKLVADAFLVDPKRVIGALLADSVAEAFLGKTAKSAPPALVLMFKSFLKRMGPNPYRDIQELALDAAREGRSFDPSRDMNLGDLFGRGDRRLTHRIGDFLSSMIEKGIQKERSWQSFDFDSNSLTVDLDKGLIEYEGTFDGESYSDPDGDIEVPHPDYLIDSEIVKLLRKYGASDVHVRFDVEDTNYDDLEQIVWKIHAKWRFDSVLVANEVVDPRKLKKSIADGLSSAKHASEDFGRVFDRLKSGQTVQVAVKSVMGRSSLFDGSFHEFKVGRRSHSKKYGVTSLAIHPVGESKPRGRGAQIKLMKRSNGNVSVAIGNMGATLKGLKT